MKNETSEIKRRHLLHLAFVIIARIKCLKVLSKQRRLRKSPMIKDLVPPLKYLFFLVIFQIYFFQRAGDGENNIMIT